jgi:AraC-like DNA-binding protein
VPDEVRWASRRLVASGGQVTVAKLAADVGWSRRRLAERFRQEVGLPPKLFARVLRFERARLRLREPDRPALAEVAAESGYYDQAHLNRDFAELAGCSPTRWLADEAFPSVQDTPAPAGGG